MDALRLNRSWKKKPNRFELVENSLHPARCCRSWQGFTKVFPLRCSITNFLLLTPNTYRCWEKKIKENKFSARMKSILSGEFDFSSQSVSKLRSCDDFLSSQSCGRETWFGKFLNWPDSTRGDESFEVQGEWVIGWEWRERDCWL